MAKYGFNEKTKSESINYGGINEGWKLKAITFEPAKKDGTGDKVLILSWMHKTQFNWRQIFFPINEQNVIEFNEKYPGKHSRDNKTLGFVKDELITDADALEIAYDDFNRHLKHILTKYVPEKQAVLEGGSYEEMAENYIKLLTSAKDWQNKEVRLKLVYDKKGNLKHPRFGAFIEDVKTTPVTKMEKNPKDVFVRPTKDKEKDEAEAEEESPW